MKHAGYLDLVNYIQEHVGLGPGVSRLVIDSVSKWIIDNLVNGNTCSLKYVGQFSLKKRMVTVPYAKQKGEPARLLRNVCKFRTSPNLRHVDVEDVKKDEV